MEKRWLIGFCALLAISAVGCRSARYRIQRYYRYPPTYYARTNSVPPKVTAPARVAETPAPSQRAAYKAPAASGPRPVAVPTHSVPAAQPKPAAEIGAETVKTERRSFWRIFSRSKETAKSSPAPAVTTAAETPAADTEDSKTDVSASGVYRLKVGDPVVVYLRGIPGVPGGEQQIENIVGEDGAIQLPYVNNISVVNMTATEAQEAIRRAYLDQQIYKQLTVNVVIPARSYYIRGEVRQPGRYPLVGTVTVLQAIAAAGGYTEFASYSVDILRGERRISLNMRKVEKRPELDQPIEAGDIIVVNRSFF